MIHSLAPRKIRLKSGIFVFKKEKKRVIFRVAWVEIVEMHVVSKTSEPWMKMSVPTKILGV